MGEIIKPVNCSCEFPAVIYRNMNGHAERCPVYADWADKVFSAPTPEGEADEGDPVFKMEPLSRQKVTIKIKGEADARRLDVNDPMRGEYLAALSPAIVAQKEYVNDAGEDAFPAFDKRVAPSISEQAQRTAERFATAERVAKQISQITTKQIGADAEDEWLNIATLMIAAIIRGELKGEDGQYTNLCEDVTHCATCDQFHQVPEKQDERD